MSFDTHPDQDKSGAPGALAALAAAWCVGAAACSLPWRDYDPRLLAASATGVGGGATSSTGSDIAPAGTAGGGGAPGSTGSGKGGAASSNSGGDSAGSAGSGGSCSSLPSTSLVLNPGFENGIVGWAFQSASAGASYSVDSGAGTGSSNAIRITNGGPSQFGAQVQQTPIDGVTKKLVKGDVYLYSSLVRGKSGSEQAVIVFQSAAGATRQCGTLTQAVTTDFARFGCRFVVPDAWDGQQLALNLRSGGDDETALFDDVYFDVGPSGGLYNGDFGEDFVGWSYFKDQDQMFPPSIGLGAGRAGAGCNNDKSLRITHTDQDSNACGVAQEPVAPLADGASYTLSLWARGDVGGEQVLVNVRDASKPWTTLTTGGATLTTIWSKVELKLGPIAAPLTGTTPLIAILNKSPGATLFVDDVSWETQ